MLIKRGRSEGVTNSGGVFPRLFISAIAAANSGAKPRLLVLRTPVIRGAHKTETISSSHLHPEFTEETLVNIRTMVGGCRPSRLSAEGQTVAAMT